MEKVADIQGYDGFYKITSDGRVLSPNGEKASYISSKGYKRVSLWKQGKHKNQSIHRLVAKAFIPNPNNYEIVNHIYVIKTHNNVENLEWCDANHNMQHAYKNGLVHPKTTKVIQYTKNFEKIREWDSIKEACDFYNLNHANVVTVCGQKTKRKYVGGFIWRYKDDQ